MFFKPKRWSTPKTLRLSFEAFSIEFGTVIFPQLTDGGWGGGAGGVVRILTFLISHFMTFN